MKVGFAAAFICFLVVATFVLYVPTTRDAQGFLAELKNEYATTAERWGERHATAVLERAFELDVLLGRVNMSIVVPAARGVTHPHESPLSTAIARAQNGFLGSDYVRSVKAMSFLALYRLSGLLETLPVSLWIFVAAIVDGAVTRTVKSKEFGTHSPEVFGVNIIAAVLILSGSIMLLVLPLTISPLIVFMLPLLLAIALRFVVANYHKTVG